ncbi:MAG: hypothetical protein BWX61_01226 [Bacteroidetes bacterium ADurb.Bin035]|nr:MAG: hypothetical protein BWX61_01226 [Bacteroidetes bacterium ADurb.Bin035]
MIIACSGIEMTSLLIISIKTLPVIPGLYFIDVLLTLALIVAVALVEFSVGLMKSITPVNVSLLYEFAISFILELFLI